MGYIVTLKDGINIEMEIEIEIEVLEIGLLFIL